MVRKIFNMLIVLFASIGMLFVGYIVFRVMDPTSASNDAKNNPGLVLIDYQTMDTLVYKKGNSNYCDSIGDSVVCKSAKNGSMVFKEWQVPEMDHADGDGAATYVIGDFKLNEDYVILLGEMNHDASQILLWNRKLNKLIVISPNDGFLYYSTKTAMFVLATDIPREGVVTWGPSDDELSIQSYYCRARKGNVVVDTSVVVLLDGKRKLVDLNHVNTSRLLNCEEDSTAIRNEVPDFLRPYEER